MILQPRKYKHKTRQKGRKKKKYLNSSLSYGHNGLRLFQPTQLTSKQLFRLNIFLKQSSRKSDKTKRSYWFNVFPHLPLTRKVKGSRMGKGVGKLKLWFTLIPAGFVLLEFKHLRKGRVLYYASQIQYKLNISSQLIWISTKRVKLDYASKTNLTVAPVFLKV